jgi:hypothetical protein
MDLGMAAYLDTDEGFAVDSRIAKMLDVEPPLFFAPQGNDFPYEEYPCEHGPFEDIPHEEYPFEEHPCDHGPFRDYGHEEYPYNDYPSAL